MKHYVLPYFPHTAQFAIDRYIAKYGDNTANLRAFGSKDNFLSLLPEAKTFVPQGPNWNHSLNKHGEVNGHVILAKQGTAPLGRVEPWDLLMVLGHGVTVDGSRQAKKFGSDPQDLLTDGSDRPLKGSVPSQGWALDTKMKDGVLKSVCYASVNDVANWLDGKLNKNHVLLKLLMCNSGGGFGSRSQEQNFAKQLAKALYDKGYKNIAVGGFRGSVEVHTSKWTVGGGDLSRDVTVQTPVANEVSDKATGQTALARENLDYYHGATPTLISANAITLVKRIFRMFAGGGKTPEDIRRLAEMVASANVRQAAQNAESYEFVKSAVRMLVADVKAKQALQPSQIVTQPKPVQKPQTQMPQTRKPMPGRARIMHTATDFPQWVRS